MAAHRGLKAALGGRCLSSGGKHSFALRLRRALSSLLISLVVTSGIINLQTTSPAQAGGPRPPILPGGSRIQPGEDTPIQLASELITITVRLATKDDNELVRLPESYYGFQTTPIWFSSVAEVDAEYTMVNPTGEAVNMTVWMPLASAAKKADWEQNLSGITPGLEGLQVSIDEKPLDYSVSDQSNPAGADKPALPWASFPVGFPSQAETVIHVSYKLPMLTSNMGCDLFYYVFHTAKGWAGPVRQVELTISLPYPASEETIAGMPAGSLRLPPFEMPMTRAELPAGIELHGSQARWVWKDFEAGPQDEFALWLLPPGKWQELEAARAAMQAGPEDGQAWLDMAYVYYSLWGANIEFPEYFPTIFGPRYIKAGAGAYQKASELLPDHPESHAGLGMLLAAQYMYDPNPSPNLIQYAQDEYQTARELEAKNPSLVKPKSRAWWLLVRLERALSSMPSFDATRTVKQALLNTEQAEETGTAALLVTPSPALTQLPTLTATFVASSTNQVSTITPPSSTKTEDDGQSPVTIVVLTAVVSGATILGYLALRRLKKQYKRST